MRKIVRLAVQAVQLALTAPSVRMAQAVVEAVAAVQHQARVAMVARGLNGMVRRAQPHSVAVRIVVPAEAADQGAVKKTLMLFRGLAAMADFTAAVEAEAVIPILDSANGGNGADGIIVITYTP